MWVSYIWSGAQFCSPNTQQQTMLIPERVKLCSTHPHALHEFGIPVLHHHASTCLKGNGRCNLWHSTNSKTDKNFNLPTSRPTRQNPLTRWRFRWLMDRLVRRPCPVRWLWNVIGFGIFNFFMSFTAPCIFLGDNHFRLFRFITHKNTLLKFHVCKFYYHNHLGGESGRKETTGET